MPPVTVNESTKIVTDEQLEEDLDKQTKVLTDLVASPSPEDRSPLHHSWRFLQIYSTWGLRLPNTEASLKSKLHITRTTADLNFFNVMLEGYGVLHQGCETFQTQAFPNVVKVGRSILDFAKEHSKTNANAVFPLIVELIDTDPVAALELVQDLKATVTENLIRANTAQSGIITFDNQLTDGDGKLNIAHEAIERDSEVSTAAIQKLEGGKEIEGSLKNISSLVDVNSAAYQHAVVVATTTLTYAWIPFIGWLAGAIVAGIWGSRAVQLLKDLDDLQDKLRKGQQQLDTAQQVRFIQNHARESVVLARERTKNAQVQTTTVKNAWSGVVGQLDFIEGKVKTMTQRDDPKALAHKRLVQRYAGQAGEKWDLLIKPLEDLTRNPYIPAEAFETHETTPRDFASKLETIIQQIDAGATIR